MPSSSRQGPPGFRLAFPVLLMIPLLMLLFPPMLSALDGDTATQTEQYEDFPEDELERSWKVAVFPFITLGDDALRAAPLVSSLPSIIVEHSSHIQFRNLSEPERIAYGRRLADSYGPSALEHQFPPQRNLEVLVYEMSYSPLLQMYNREIRSIILDGNAPGTTIFHRLAEDSEADLIISGSVEVQGGYVFIEILLIDPFEGRIISRDFFSLRSIEAVTQIQSLIGSSLGKALYNGPSADLSIIMMSDEEVESAQSGEEVVAGEPLPMPGTPSEPGRVYVDGRYRGLLPANAWTLSAGPHLVEVYRGNVLIHRSEVTIADGENRVLEFSPDDDNATRFLLTTDPPGMDVYDGSSFLGITPLLVKRPSDPSYLQLRMGDDPLRYLLISPDTPDDFQVLVPPMKINWERQLEKDRRDFYGSLGFTVASVIVPILANGVYQDLLGSYTSDMDSTQTRNLNRKLAVANTLSTTGYWVTFISFIHTLDQLFVYLDTAETARGVIPVGEP